MDSGDAPDERRYTVAHEIAHFVMDYLHPRQEALSLFGEMIRPALDGDRATSLTERIDARLADVPLGIYVNLLPRTAAGRIESGPVLRAEERADRLALELLAPLEAVQRDLGAFEGESRAFVAAAAEVLRTTFGLPDRVAREYAVWLEGRLSPPSSREWLGL